MAADLHEALAAVEARVSYLRSATAAPPDEGWIACADLVAGGPTLVDLIASTGEGRGAHDQQVAASLFTQAYAFRVAGVALAAYSLGLPVPSLAPATTAITIARNRPSAIAYLDAEPRPSDPQALAADLLGGHLAPFIAAVRDEVTVGERLLWGNVAASCAVAFRAVEGESPDERAEIRARADAFSEVAAPWLEGLGRYLVVEGEARDGWYWERTNCCLWYQASGGSMCDDCSLLDPDERLAGWREQLKEPA
jgi:ferric iron reductase protein FhuF